MICTSEASNLAPKEPAWDRGQAGHSGYLCSRAESIEFEVGEGLRGRARADARPFNSYQSSSHRTSDIRPSDHQATKPTSQGTSSLRLFRPFHQTCEDEDPLHRSSTPSRSREQRHEHRRRPPAERKEVKASEGATTQPLPPLQPPPRPRYKTPKAEPPREGVQCAQHPSIAPSCRLE